MFYEEKENTYNLYWEFTIGMIIMALDKSELLTPTVSIPYSLHLFQYLQVA
jgi:hypothetical protein